jgi:dolichyl-phosphate-mannose-protein mannosyltransferase
VRAAIGSALLSPILVFVVTAILFSRRLGDPSIDVPDSNRIRMDGVFLLDFFRALPLDRIYEFTARYYAQYPALSIGYRPPFFPLVEALFNATFGINVWSSRLAILPFAVVGITAWHRLVQRLFDRTTAFWATLLVGTTPFLVEWGWYTMNDLPVLFLAMLLAYVFHRSTESAAPRYVYGSALVFVLAAWTKQTAVFLPLWLLLYLAVTGRLRGYLARREVWIALVAAVVLLAPLAVMTFMLGDFNITQSIGSAAKPDALWRLHWRNLAKYPAGVVREQLPLVVILLSVVGMGAAVSRRDRRLLYFALLIVSTYAFFTYLVAKDGRYTIFWLPPITLFAALPLVYLARFPRRRLAYAALLGLVTVAQVAEVYARTPGHATGYHEAAEWVLRHRESEMVFFDGQNDGSFIYFIRVLDPKRSMFVLRGDKLLTSAVMYKRIQVQVHAHSRQDIHDIFDRYGVVHVVVERDDRSTIAIHHELRAFLRTGPFELVKVIPVDSNVHWFAGQTLEIYRYRTPKPRTATQLVLRAPLVGLTITVPISPSGPP